MPQVATWFSRKFEFSLPVELYPNLQMRLRGTPARLEEIARASSVERMRRAPEGKWSAQEHAGHLLALEPLWMARIEDFLGARTEMTVADLTNRSTFESQFNKQPVEKILAGFRHARLELSNRVAKIDPAQFAHTLPHPRLKTPMRLIDHLFFVAEHDDHHLAMIWEMIRA